MGQNVCWRRCWASSGDNDLRPAIAALDLREGLDAGKLHAPLSVDDWIIAAQRSCGESGADLRARLITRIRSPQTIPEPHSEPREPKATHF